MSDQAITVIGFTAIIAALVVLEILARRKIGRIPTIGEWLGFVMRRPLGRALMLAGWLWLGWHYFAR
jgi:hypothetical protein